MIRIRKFVFGAIVMAMGVPVHASSNVDQMYQDELWKQMKGQTNLAFKRVTSGGDFAGCELTFKYAYRDIRSKEGKPLLVLGALANFYFEGKLSGYLLKIQPIQFGWNDATNTGVRTVLTPAQATLAINGVSVNKYVRPATTCETGGICVPILSKDWDEELKLLEVSTKQPAFDAEIFWSLTKGGLDESFKLSTLKAESGTNLQVRRQFSQCLLEVMQMQQDSIKPKAVK